MHFERPAYCVHNETLNYCAIRLGSLISFAVMPQPARFVATFRIMVRPVNDSAFRIPLVDAVEFYGIAFSK